jgi:hydroxymethylbilane synthase
MSVIRVGTRGSDLALKQADWVCDVLREVHPSLTVERVIIKTHGDVATDQSFDSSWPVGAFVGALESALAEDRIDLAVHSLKDLQTEPTTGLVVAAIPPREASHDVLLTRAAIGLEDLPVGARIGTSSPRRAAQMRRRFDVEIVPLRGNVPTRIVKMERDKLDGVVLAAAGINRLGIEHPHIIDLPIDRFVPAPGQGALAVQGCGGSAASELAGVLDDTATRRAVTAERQFLHDLGAGCHTPAGAFATVSGETISLHGQLFSDDGVKCVGGVEEGDDPLQVGARLAEKLMGELQSRDVRGR